MIIRNGILGLALLTLAGCGCGSDSFSDLPVTPAREAVSVTPASVLPPCEVPESEAGARQIDVVFCLDDGLTMVRNHLGVIPTNLLEDRRDRSDAAQAIMRNLQANALSELQARFPGEELDIAFGVVRYEDYGGAFAASGRGFPGDADADARPYILQMPVLRQNHPQFAALFADAIARETPGRGTVAQGTNELEIDPNTGIEALWQIATGTGFDADGSGDLGSGAPCAISTQLTPGTSGDVPAVTWNAAPDETDPDGRPVFFVRGSNGVVTENPIPGTSDTTPCIASGNIGGVGWRNNATRMVIIATDRATVAPFTQDPGALDGSSDITVLSTVGTTPSPALPQADPVLPATGPREARAVTSQAFNGDTGRFGLASNTAIAPSGAATVQETIRALNDLHIEVLCLASPTLVNNQAKPNGGQDGDGPADVDDVVAGVGLGELGDPTILPWTWLSAVSILSGSQIRFQDETLANVELPAVYNLATVWPIDPAATQVSPDVGADESTITDDVREDFLQRFAGPAGIPARGWISGDWLAPITSGLSIDPEDLPIVTVPVTLAAQPGAGFFTVFFDNGSFANQTLASLEIPVHVAGSAAPASTPTSFAPYVFQDTGDENQPFPASDSLRYTITADLSAAQFTPRAGADTAVFNQVVAFLQGKFRELGSTVALTDASMVVTLEEVPAGGSESIPDEVAVGSVFDGCGTLDVQDQGVLPVGSQPCDPFASGGA